MGEKGGKGHDRRGQVSTICVEEGLRKGRQGGRTPSVTGLEREDTITCSTGGFDEGQGPWSHVAYPEKRKLRSRDR
ncbi:hypothetical protein AMTRI_Chr08g168950 [Amborella trichopoda]